MAGQGNFASAGHTLGWWPQLPMVMPHTGPQRLHNTPDFFYMKLGLTTMALMSGSISSTTWSVARCMLSSVIPDPFRTRSLTNWRMGRRRRAMGWCCPMKMLIMSANVSCSATHRNASVRNPGKEQTVFHLRGEESKTNQNRFYNSGEGGKLK